MNEIIINKDFRSQLGIPQIKAKKTAIYKHKNKNNEIIYVGISDNAHNRSIQHLSTSDWKEEISLIEVEWVENRLLAEIKEIEYIKKIKPKYNRKHNNRHSAMYAVQQRLNSFIEDKKRENEELLGEYLDHESWIDSIENSINHLQQKKKTKNNVKQLEDLHKVLDEALMSLEEMQEDDEVDALLIERIFMHKHPKEYILSFLLAGHEKNERDSQPRS
tara:strand:+ start:635 stop:1288 length:654 start_codon:yes stop_codon:yes gene_type:complete